MAETIADDVLTDRFCWAGGLGWHLFDGRRWRDCTEVIVGEAVRRYVLHRFHEAATQDNPNGAAVRGWQAMLGAGRERSVLGLAKGIVEVRVDAFDADPDVLNTASGIVDLTTGQVMPHDPQQYMRKIAGADYRPGYRHPDWTTALEAIPADVRDWYQLRLGQAITGHTPTDDLLVITVGGGANGKSTINATTAAAVGDYFLMVSDRALMGDPGQHPTELCDFMGARYAVLEETPEARRLDPQRLKRTVGTPTITARRIRQDSITFRATHSLFLSTNHKPIVEESDPSPRVVGRHGV
jgi:phage/plasmid-associated DNA primase